MAQEIIDFILPPERIVVPEGKDGFVHTMKAGFSYTASAAGTFDTIVINVSNQPLELPFSRMILKKVQSNLIFRQAAAPREYNVPHSLSIGTTYATLPDYFKSAATGSPAGFVIAGAPAGITVAGPGSLLITRILFPGPTGASYGAAVSVVEPPPYVFSSNGGINTLQVRGESGVPHTVANGDSLNYDLAMVFECYQ